MGHSGGQGWEIVVAVIGNVCPSGQQTTQDPANEVSDDQVSSLTIANWPGKQAFFWPMEIESGLRPGNGGFFWPMRGGTEQWPGKGRGFWPSRIKSDQRPDYRPFLWPLNNILII